MPIRRKNNSPRLAPDAISISMLAGDSPSGRRDVLLDGRLEVLSWKGVFPADRLLIEGAASTSGERILAAMTSSALPALALHRVRPEAAVAYAHIDLFHVSSALNLFARNEAEGAIPVFCEPVLPQPTSPDAAPDLILVNLRADDEVGLSLELLHQAHHRLAKGGKLLATTDNPRDTWLAEKLERIFGNLTRLARDKRALLYSVKKKDDVAGGEAARVRELFIQRVEVEDGAGERLAFETCYGTFSSHRLDDGSGALLRELEAPSPCNALLDLGCGWGGLGILAARKTGAKRLYMIDANARAVAMAERNLAKHCPPDSGMQTEVRLEANAESLEAPELAGAFDLVVANPPYGSEFRVSELFIRAASRALRKGGRLYLVAKNNQRLLKLTEAEFGNVEETRRWGYQVIRAEKQ